MITLPPAADRRKRANSSRRSAGILTRSVWLSAFPLRAERFGETAGALAQAVRRKDYFKCLLTSLVISNMLTWDLPPKTGFNVASDLIIRLFLASCSPFFLM